MGQAGCTILGQTGATATSVLGVRAGAGATAAAEAVAALEAAKLALAAAAALPEGALEASDAPLALESGPQPVKPINVRAASPGRIQPRTAPLANNPFRSEEASDMCRTILERRLG